MENLWKKESNAAGAIYVDLFGDQETIETKYKLKKSNNISTKRRNEGNILFRQNLVNKAMESYNESLCFAEIGTENVSLAYANRSSCFLRMEMYEKCLIDIEFAIKANYPERLMPKLEKRKADCMKLMGSNDQHELKTPKLSYEADKNFPGMANVLEIKQNKEFGRYIAAKCDIPAGKTVLIEKSFASIETKESFRSCLTCHTVEKNFVACQNCAHALFCDEECMKLGSFHAKECGIWYGHHDLIPMERSSQIIFRSIYNGIEAFENIEQLMEYVGEIVKKPSKEIPNSIADPRSRYFAFLNLQPHTRYDLILTSYSKGSYLSIMAIPFMKQSFNTKAKRRFLMHLIMHHTVLQLLNQNRSVRHPETGEMESFLEGIISYGVIASLFNHQCAPNLLKFGYRNSIVCITIRPISKGEQLFESYGDYASNLLLPINGNGFRCRCEKCEPKPISIQQKTLLNSMQFDPLFQCVVMDGDYTDYIKRNNLEEKCIVLLNKYGRLPVTKSLQIVIDLLTKCYVEYDYIF